MEPSIVRRRAFRPAAIAAAMSLGFLSFATPAPAGTFTTLSGNWAGSGTVTMANGQQDRLRCIARYLVEQGGDRLNLNIRCASDNYKFDLVSTVVDHGGRLSGDWRETSRNASGTITGRSRGGRIEVTARSDMFTASMSLNTRTDRQSVTIVPEGTEVSKVSLTLSKR